MLTQGKTKRHFFNMQRRARAPLPAKDRVDPSEQACNGGSG